MKDVCAATKEPFQHLEKCMMEQVMDYVPASILWSVEACKVALQEHLVMNLVHPESNSTANWREAVKRFPNSVQCQKGKMV